MRSRLAMASSSGSASPSEKPCAAATDQLPVATARAPAAATARALPASQALNSTSGSPATCSRRNASASDRWSLIGVAPGQGTGSLARLPAFDTLSEAREETVRRGKAIFGLLEVPGKAQPGRPFEAQRTATRLHQADERGRVDRRVRSEHQ